MIVCYIFTACATIRDAISKGLSNVSSIREAHQTTFPVPNRYCYLPIISQMKF